MNIDNKSKRVFLFYYTSACVLVLFLVMCYSAFDKIAISASTERISNEKPIVIIDSGHGGEDGGAVASDGTLEKDINLSISLKLRDFLLQSGFEVKMIRETDVSVCDENLQTVKERKKSDIYNRLEMFNSSENNVVISVHQNKFEQSKYSGTQTFYSPNNEQSAVLAECIQNSVVSFLQPQNNRQCKKADKNIYLLYNAQVPAVIAECGFLSNEAELENLKREEYQNKMAYSIYFGFLNYYNMTV